MRRIGGQEVVEIEIDVLLVEICSHVIQEKLLGEVRCSNPYWIDGMT